jgi:hypothetical protein
MQGVVTRAAADTLIVDARRSGSRTPVATVFLRQSLMRVEVQRGRSTSAARVIGGMALGLVSGALIGGVVGYQVGGRSCNGECREAGNEGVGKGLGAFAFAVGGGALGTAVGGLAGSLPRPKWERVFP